MRFPLPGLWLLLLLSFWICGDSAQAQNRQPAASPGPLTLEVASPLALTARPLSVQVRKGRWFPVAVTLTNTGEPVQGKLTMRLSTATDQRRSATEYFSLVDLPTNARKRVWLYGRAEREDIDRCEISFQGRGFKTMRAEGVIQVAAEETRLVLTISNSDEKLSYLAGLKGPGLALPQDATPTDLPQFGGGSKSPNLNASNQPVRPLGAPHDLIPSRWIGLDAVDLVVLQDFPHAALTPVQIATLRGYAAGGGALLALGGANWQRLSTSPLADLWPVVPQSSGTAPAGDVSTLIDRFARFPNMTGADRLGGAPVVATRANLKPGRRSLIGQSSAPILAANDFGAGQVLFLSVDPTQPPFLGWRGHARLWADIFRPSSRPAQIATVGEPSFDDEGNPYAYQQQQIASPSDGLLEALKTSKQLKTPPVSTIAWFLALYVFFLVPVNYVVLRYFDRRELAWVTIPVIVLAFSVMSYAAALRIKGTAILTRQVNIVQTSDGSGLARADAMLWLFSPKKTTYDISSKDPQMVVGDYLTDNNVGVAIRQPEENQAFALDDAPINMWDWRSFVGHSTADMKGGVKVAVQSGKVGIANLSPYDLKGTVLVSNGQVRSFRTVPAGRTSFDGQSDGIKLANAQLAGRIRKASRLEEELPRNQVGGFESIPDKLLSTALSKQWNIPSTFIVAWSDQPFAGLTIGREDARAQNLTLLVVRVEDDRAVRAALAATAGSASTSRKGRVRRLSVEAVASSNNRQAGSIYTYEAELATAQAKRVSIALQLAFGNQYAYDEAPNLAIKTPTLELFDFSQGSWRAVAMRDLEAAKRKSAGQKASPPMGLNPGRAPGAPPAPVPAPQSAQQRKWNLQVVVSGNLARRFVQKPDGRLQLRVRTYHDEVRPLSVDVQSR